MENLLIPYEARTNVGRGKALVLAPHPDDEVFGCGGAIMRHVEVGDPVRVIVVTDGGWQEDAGSETKEYVRRRQDECRNAAQVLGYGVPEFWGLADRHLCCNEKLVSRIGTAIADFTPAFVYAPSLYEIHPDHRALAMAAIEAVRRAGVILVMYEIGAPFRPNCLLDITNLRERKRQAMYCFKTQLVQNDYVALVEALNRFRTYTLPAGVEAAEAYWLLDGKTLPGNAAELYSLEAEEQRRYGSCLTEQRHDMAKFSQHMLQVCGGLSNMFAKRMS